MKTPYRTDAIRVRGGDNALRATKLGHTQ